MMWCCACGSVQVSARSHASPDTPVYKHGRLSMLVCTPVCSSVHCGKCGGLKCPVWCSAVYCVQCALVCTSVYCVTCGEHSPPLGGHTTIHCSPTLVLTLISLNYSHKPTLNSLTESLSSLTDSTQTTTQRITQLAHRITSLLELLFPH